MPANEPVELRASFRRFAGQERYGDFVRAINRVERSKGRLRFWQKQLWEKFVATIPSAPHADEEVMGVFRFCDVHDRPLQPPADDESLPAIRETAEFERAQGALFPFANNGDRVCLECRAEREKWRTENPTRSAIFVGRTTYEAYCDRQLEGWRDMPRLREKVLKRSADIAARMGPGDELWEWDAGGWDQLAGRAGLAIVRNGKVVESWCEWKS